MTIVSCPKCGDSVTMPAGASVQATVRCPLCQESFALADILNAMPPALIVVDDPGAAKSAAAAEPVVGPVQFGELPLSGAEPETSEFPMMGRTEQPEGASSATAFSIETAARAAGGTAAVTPARRRALAKRPRKKTGPVMEGVKIVFGGVLGLVIAQAILWWMPWTKYRKDPFKLGPKVSQYAPWIVPEVFHAAAAPNGELQDTNARTAVPGTGAFGTSASRPPFDLSGAGPQRPFTEPSQPPIAETAPKAKKPKPQKEKASADAKKETAAAPGPAADLAQDTTEASPTEPKLELAPPPNALDDVLKDLSVNMDLPSKVETDPTAMPGAPDIGGADAPKEDTAPAATPVLNAPKVTAAELRTAIEEATTMVQAWTTAEDADSLRLLPQAYRALAKLAEAVTFAADATDEDKQSVSALLKSVSADSENVKLLGLAAAQWLKTPERRDGAGVLVVGKVKTVDQQGELFATEVEIAEGEPAVLVFRPTDPKGEYSAGARVLILGRIVPDPAANLAGFEGDAESVVVHGLSYVLAEKDGP